MPSSVPIVLASEVGIPVEDILMQKWRKSFGGKAANLRTELARRTKFDFDAIESDDAIDAIAIGLHCLRQRGFSLLVQQDEQHHCRRGGSCRFLHKQFQRWDQMPHS